MRASASSPSESSPELPKCSWVSLLAATVTEKNSSGHRMSAWQLQAAAHSPFPHRVTLTWCREKHTHQLSKVQGSQHNHQQSTSASFSIPRDSNNQHCWKSKTCKTNLNMDFLLISLKEMKFLQSFRNDDGRAVTSTTSRNCLRNWKFARPL